MKLVDILFAKTPVIQWVVYSGLIILQVSSFHVVARLIMHTMHALYASYCNQLVIQWIVLNQAMSFLHCQAFVRVESQTCDFNLLQSHLKTSHVPISYRLSMVRLYLIPYVTPHVLTKKMSQVSDQHKTPSNPTYEPHACHKILMLRIYINIQIHILARRKKFMHLDPIWHVRHAILV